MEIEFKLPELGENVHSGDIVKVLVREGQTIEANQGVCELETDKAVVEIPCPHAGRIVKVHFTQGQTVQVGQTLLTLVREAEKPQSAPPPPPAELKAAPAPAAEPAPPATAFVSPPRTEGAPSLDVASHGTATLRGQGRFSPVLPAPIHPPIDGGAEGIELMGPIAGISAPSTPRPAEPLYGPDEPIPAGPATRRLARELGVDLRSVRGSGPRGRITPEDVQAAAQSAVAAQSADIAERFTGAAEFIAPRVVSSDARSQAAVPRPEGPSIFWQPIQPPGEPAQDNWGPIRREKMSRIRQTIAAQMVRSASTIPHVTNFDDADVTELEQLRRQVPPGYLGANVKLTLMPFVMKAVAIALRHHPVLNASIDEEKQEITYKEYVHLGIAVDTPRGLVVPVIRNVDRMSIPELARAVANVAERARNVQFAIEELRGGTFSISNLGAVGGAYSTPIINYPEAGILLLGKARWLPVVRDGRVEPRFMLPLSLSYDHRLVDGAAAGRFLNEVIDWLQNPGRLLLAG